MLKLNFTQFQTFLASASFLILFPGFFFYHYGVAAEFFPPYLSGYFGIISIFLIVPLFLMNIKMVINNFYFPVALFFIIMLYTLSVTIIQYSKANPLNASQEMFEWGIAGIVFNIVCFCLASRLSIQKIATIGYWTVYVMVLIVLFNIDTNYRFFYLKAQAGELSDVVAGYQQIARSIVVILLIGSAYFYQRSFRLYSLVILGVIALFFNGARSEFVLFIASFLFLIFTHSIKSTKTLVFMFFIFLMAIFFLMNLFSVLPQTRMTTLLTLTDASTLLRISQIEFAINQISQFPFLGNYASYVDEFGGTGSVPHNILSAWLNLGLLGFVLYIFMFIALWGSALRGFLNNEKDIYFNLFLIFLVFTTAALVVTKVYSYMFVGLLLGFYIQYRNKLDFAKKN